jgi:glycosyltransferase involved in cell wall biosynthesis
VAADWIVTQIGSREHYAVPRAFLRRGRLRHLFTDAWCRVGRGLLGNGPAALRALAGRYHPEIPSSKVTAFTFEAVLDGLHRRRSAGIEAEHLEYIRIGKRFCEAVNRRIGHKMGPDEFSFYGYNTGCLETIQMLQAQRVRCIVNQIDPARVEEELVLEEVKRWPGWEKAEGRKPEVYWRRLEQEWRLADTVVVNSQWSKAALVQQGVSDEKISVIPLAYENAVEHVPDKNLRGPLHVLWLGSVILRKGIQYLIEAAKLLSGKDVQITVAGPIGISDEAVKSAPANMNFIDRLTRDQAAEMYRQADVFVLPTISDGFAITQLEAMSHGLPVIATLNCGQVVSDGVDGRIVPIRDANSLAAAIIEYATNREKLRDASAAAIRKSKQFSLQHLANWLEELDTFKLQSAR